MKVTLCQRCVRLDLCCCPPRSVHTPRGQKKKSRVFFLTCVMLHGLCPVAAKALTSAMTVFSINLHHVFFLFKPSLLLLLYNHQVTTHTRMLYIELFIIKDCTLIFQSTYYMYKWRADRFQYFYPLNWAGTLFFFFFFCFIGKRTGKIYQGISCSILKWWRLEVKKKFMKMYVQGPTEKGKNNVINLNPKPEWNLILIGWF